MVMSQVASRSLVAALVATVLATVPTAPARASLVMALDLAQLVGRADRVLVGEVLSVESAWDSDRRRIHTTAVIQVAEMLKGEAPANGRVVVVQPGGTVGDIEMRVHGMPRFVAGGRAVLFVRGALPAAVVGMGQGLRPLRFDTAARRWMVEGGDRSAAVNVDAAGRFAAAGPEPALPLEELRRRVRALVRP
jgi:hypothetical protein